MVDSVALPCIEADRSRRPSCDDDNTEHAWAMLLRITRQPFFERSKPYRPQLPTGAQSYITKSTGGLAWDIFTQAVRRTGDPNFLSLSSASSFANNFFAISWPEG